MIKGKRRGEIGENKEGQKAGVVSKGENRRGRVVKGKKGRKRNR